MSKYLIIDGYNAISKIKHLEEIKDIDLEASRMAFIAMINDFMQRKKVFDRVFLVFDSKNSLEYGITRHSYGNVEVCFSNRDMDADGAIVSMLKDALSKDQISVSSDDNFVCNHARAFGRDVMSISELKNIILLKKKPVRSKIKEQKLEKNDLDSINEELKKRWNLE